MKYAIAILALLLFGLAAGSCNPPVPIIPPLDAGDAGPDVCTLACQNLAALGCSEATPNCVAVCRHNRNAGLVPLDTKCAATATTREAARACAGITCLP